MRPWNKLILFCSVKLSKKGWIPRFSRKSISSGKLRDLAKSFLITFQLCANFIVLFLLNLQRYGTCSLWKRCWLQFILVDCWNDSCYCRFLRWVVSFFNWCYFGWFWFVGVDRASRLLHSLRILLFVILNWNLPKSTLTRARVRLNNHFDDCLWRCSQQIWNSSNANLRGLDQRVEI